MESNDALVWSLKCLFRMSHITGEVTEDAGTAQDEKMTCNVIRRANEVQILSAAVQAYSFVAKKGERELMMQIEMRFPSRLCYL